ncbi:IS4 family transposase [Aneurinibacillus soli]|uniref:Transposase DDE domain protein n=2 Tax=Aneurinibacillus soli TaxID=1500254 RepID=A0A0U5BM58_9BACL|nr:IS4 family transposase [Aneurinibacillus soli]BAU27211.1 Transposase DDE domain protein [Aneurinibacillus soli]BAU29278.1 Transposase DDE domain protein [Aneurinibacillus soli]BAU29432.1 Transposase DDE domain protein [Aneurinibacillus soli]
MKKSTTFTTIVQTLLSEEEIQSVVQDVEYEEKARKFTTSTLLHYWAMAAFEEWEGFRYGADRSSSCGLPSANYSTFSKKASDVPYTVFKKLFHHLVSKCNRATRRKLAIPKKLLLVDSTTITVGKPRLPWALYHGKRAGIKLHVAFDPDQETPVHVIESIGSKHDSPFLDQLANPSFLLVADRAYGKIERFDQYLKDKQSFVIRIKENVTIDTPRSLRRCSSTASSVIKDSTCYLGTSQCRSQERHRVIFFTDDEGNEIRVVTDRRDLSAEKIAEIYKARWQIETFFRWIKQHVNVPVLFGTTKNAVYGQLYTALITYVLIKWIYEKAKPMVSRFAMLSFIQFARLLRFESLQVEWMIAIHTVVSESLLIQGSSLSKIG